MCTHTHTRVTSVGCVLRHKGSLPCVSIGEALIIIVVTEREHGSFSIQGGSFVEPLNEFKHLRGVQLELSPYYIIIVHTHGEPTSAISERMPALGPWSSSTFHSSCSEVNAR